MQHSLEEAHEHFKTITPRERQVLQAASVGKTSKAIAHEMGIAIRTVEHYKAIAIKKLGCESTTHAACEAVRKMIIA